MNEAKIMPHNLDAEKSVLGACFLDTRVVATVRDKLELNDFYDIKHKNIYKALILLLDEDQKIDFTTVSVKLASLNVMKQVGVDYLSHVVDFTPTITHLDAYIEVVKEYSLKRAMIEVTAKIHQEGFNPTISTIDYVDYAEELILKLIRRRRAGEFLNIQEILVEVRKKAEIRRSETDVTGVDTGFGKLNFLTSGFQNEELIILAARPGVGKSAFAMNLALQICKNNKDGKAGVAIFSLEMSNEQLVSRMLSAESMVDNRLIKIGRLTPNDWHDINAASAALNNYKLYFDDTATVKVNDIRAKCRKLKQEGNLDFVIIDYLQLITESKPGVNRQENVAEISRGLKLMARELEIPVLALSQLSRDIEKRGEKIPVLADLRESGAIEQDADIVMFMYEVPDLEDIIEVSIAKNRQGQTGRFKLKFQKSQSKFNSVTERDDD